MHSGGIFDCCSCNISKAYSLTKPNILSMIAELVFFPRATFELHDMFPGVKKRKAFGRGNDGSRHTYRTVGGSCELARVGS